MGIFDFFKRLSNSSDNVSTLVSSIHPDGLLLTFEHGVDVSDIDTLLEASESTTTEEKLLRAYLSDLLIDEQCKVTEQGILIDWESFYSLASNPEHSSLIALLQPPPITRAVPILSNIGSVSDSDFKIEISGWMLEGQKVEVTVLNNPEVKVQGERAIVSGRIQQLLSFLLLQNKKGHRKQTQAENEAYWGKLRALALNAGALFGSRYLSTTIILTPETLRIPTKQQDTQFGRVFTVEPTFDDAPEGWLNAFDNFQSVQDHYDITKSGGRIRVILSEPVKKVLEVVKREMPGRKVAGARAEKFAHNPKAFLGDYAEGVLGDIEVPENNDEIGVKASTFHLVPEISKGLISSATLIINEFYTDGFSRSFKESILTPDALAELTTRIGDALGDDREIVPFQDFDLSLDANAEIEFESMLNLLRTWQQQGEAVIKLEDIYELDGYSERIEGIGVANPIYVPVLQKEKKEEGNGWMPEDLTPILKIMLPGGSEPVFVPLSEEWVEAYEKKVIAAETSGTNTVQDNAIPTAMETPQARILVDGFKTLLDGQLAAITSKACSDNGEKKTHKKKETLLVKTNFHGMDYIEARKELLTLPDGTQPRLPSSLMSHVSLKEHQRFGIAWFQHLFSKAPGEVRGALLADDMGLGKTLQLLNVLGRLYEDQPDASPSLILVPKSLLQNWASEVDKFFTSSFPKPLILYGNELVALKQPKDLIDEQLRTRGIADLLVPNWIGSYKLVITTYDVLTGYEFSFAKQDFTFVICDEAQRIKNPAAQVSTAVRKLKAKFRIACTGTPVENSLIDLWCLFDFFQPGLLGALEEFFKTYRKPIECKTGDQFQALHRLQSLIRPQTLRRTKQDIASELPTKFFAISGKQASERKLKVLLERDDLLKVDMTDHQRLLYKGGLKKLQDARQEKDGKRRGRLSFEALHFMKAVCAEPYCLPGRKFVPDPGGFDTHLKNSPKLAWMLKELEAIKAKDEKAIIFTEIREIQTALHYFLREHFKLKPFIVNGDSENRQSYIDKFSVKAGFDVIILSPLAAGAGLNVTAANHVFHFTRAWNPAKEAQATDRAYRIGQDKDVIVYCPTIVDQEDSLYSTFEERLDQLLKEKSALASSTIDGDDLSKMLNGSVGEVKFTEFMTGDGKIETTSAKHLNIGDVDRLDGESFEIFSSLFFTKKGYLVQVTEKKRGDGGIDLVGINNGSGILVQCKSSQSSKIGWDAVKEVVGGTLRYQSRYPSIRFKRIAITNQYFNENAIAQASLNQVMLVNRDDIKKLLETNPITDLEFEEMLCAT